MKTFTICTSGGLRDVVVVFHVGGGIILHLVVLASADLAPTTLFRPLDSTPRHIRVPKLFLHDPTIRRPFLTPSLRRSQPSPQSFAGCTTSEFVHSLDVVVSTGASSVINPTQPLHVPLGKTDDLSTLCDSHFPFPHSPTTPINIVCLKTLLSGYTTEVVDFLVSGFTHGFHIGYTGPCTVGREKNNLSAHSNVSAVSSAIFKELSRGHTVGPFSIPPFQSFHCSPLGAVPKKDGTFRIILDLSSPLGTSINEGIPSQFFTVKYSSFDDAVSIVRDLGKGCFMAKIDIKHAFRLCPVHRSAWPLLGYKWLGKYYFDIRLPFGSRSSPFIFNTFADALTWILVHKFGLTCVIHYLDDFFICASTFSECQQKVSTILAVFQRLGVPIARDKLEGPSQCLIFLGIEIDSINSCVRLPEDKLVSLSTAVVTWIRRKKCLKSELLSLIGSLSFACKVIKPGRIFLRRLIDLSTTVSKLHHHIDLNSSIRADLVMWSDLLQSWNGVSIIQSPVSSINLNLFTDASFLGLGVYFDGAWISLPWPINVSSFNIATLELFAVYAAIFTWGDSLSNRQITIYTDNEAIVYVWSFGSSRDKSLMTLFHMH